MRDGRETPIHRYAESARRGAAGEARVLAHLHDAHGWRCEPAGMAEQWRGVDLRATLPDGSTCRVEVKCDARAQQTHRAFVETVSNDVTGRPGWAHTCEADWLLYFVPGPNDDVLYWLRPADIRRALPTWEYAADAGGWGVRRVAARNEGYRTLGLAVALAELERIAVRVESL